MSLEPDDHEELSPLLRLRTRLEQRLEMNERHAERHPDVHVRDNAAIRVEVYRLVLSEVNGTIDEVARDQVDRVVAKRVKQQAVATLAAVKAMKGAVT